MATPNDSITVASATAAGSVTVATHKPTGSTLEYQTVMYADPYGALETTQDTYYLTVTGVLGSASRTYLVVLSSAGSSKTLDIMYARVSTMASAALTGLVRRFTLHRVVNASGGTGVTAEKFDTSSPNPPTQLNCRVGTGIVITATGDNYAIGALSEEETGGANAFCELFNWRSSGRPITIATGQGIAISQDSVGCVGQISACLHFRVR